MATAHIDTLPPDNGDFLKPYHAPALTATGVNVKAARGNLYGGSVYNDGTAAAYLHLYDKATAPTVGTDVPVLTIGVPTKASVPILPGKFPVTFANGIGAGASAAAADNDATAATLVVNLWYR